MTEPEPAAGTMPRADDASSTETADHKDAFVYATEFDVDDENEAHAIVARMVGRDRDVLELGCAEGSTTRVLKDRGCRVVGLELDPAAAAAARSFAEAVHVCDLDVADIAGLLGTATFDVILAADTLEHLRDPVRCLRACLAHLRPGGEVVLSIPNVAHADVRLSLADGRFTYTPWGLLDETHLRFFTRTSVLELLDDCGLAEVEMSRVTRPIGGTELSPRLEQFPELVEYIASDPEAETYQFVLRAVVRTGSPHLEAVWSQRLAAEREVEALRRTLREVEGYRAAHRRLMHLVCPDLLDVGLVGPGGLSLPQQARALRQAVERLIEDLASRTRDLDLRQRERDAAWRKQEQLERERDDAAAQLADIRLSETYRLGRAVVSPYTAARRWRSRVAHAWRLSGEGDGR